jgi:23S rRNA (guanosine2251-2'-O)-methyltransferase
MELRAVLHDIRSMHNVGSIFRTADAAGVSRIHLCGVTPLPVDRLGRVRPQVAKVALGAETAVPWTHHLRLADALRTLKKEGFRIVALEQAPDATPFFKAKFPKDAKLALVLGEEVHGLSPAILRKCDEIIEIPMLGKKESLNVAVAFGIAAFALRYKV